MRKLMLSVLVLSSAITSSAFAATYNAGSPYSQLLSIGATPDCNNTLYDPDVFVLSDGRVAMYGQGNDGDNFCSKGMDSLYRSVRATSGTWTNPADGSCPAMTGPVRCDNPGISGADPSGPLASPSVVKVGSVYYMAYVSGNADLEQGRVLWARSTDGLTWDTLGGSSNPTPVLQPVDSRGACNTYGVGQVELAYEGGYFYLYADYFHYQDAYNGPFDTIAYRIAYNSADYYGLGTTRQIYKGGTTNNWVSHNGQLQFTYAGGTLPAGYDEYGQGRGFAFGGGDVEWDATRSKWVHFYSWDNAIRWQETSSLSTGTWSTPVDVNVSAIYNAFTGSSTRYAPAVWYGDVTDDGVSNPRWYIFAPVAGSGSCGPAFYGLSIAIAPLDYY